MTMHLPEGTKPGQLWTIKEAAGAMGLNQWAVWNWFRHRTENGFMAYRIGGRIYVRAGEFVRWIEANLQPI
ncbi:MAG: hypothetical protein A2Y76_01510 [Planctomycetes bacterium RBG_13_60_9]|nr:MAG: hypothetical protein A2Y76_01510 [Planctomycetes bacterium RBG_13_60_9]